MKKFTLTVLSLILLRISTLHAFTLNTNINASYDKEVVRIYVTSNSTCNNAGVSNSELLDIAVDAANKFWNRVPTSYLRIKAGGFFTTNDSKFTSGILCVTDSDTSCDESTSIPAVKDIVIACNSDTTKNFTSSSFYALTVPNNFSNKKIKGSMIIINDSTETLFNQLSREEMVNVLGHELGHAIGIGHSKDDAALMYYSKISYRNRLGQDDIDAVTYLYPNKLHGCSGILGSIKDIKNDTPSPNLSTLSFLGLLIAGLFCVILFLNLMQNLIKSMKLLRS